MVFVGAGRAAGPVLNAVQKQAILHHNDSIFTPSTHHISTATPRRNTHSRAHLRHNCTPSAAAAPLP